MTCLLFAGCPCCSGLHHHPPEEVQAKKDDNLFGFLGLRLAAHVRNGRRVGELPEAAARTSPENVHVDLYGAYSLSKFKLDIRYSSFIMRYSTSTFIIRFLFIHFSIHLLLYGWIPARLRLTDVLALIVAMTNSIVCFVLQ